MADRRPNFTRLREPAVTALIALAIAGCGGSSAAPVPTVTPRPLPTIAPIPTPVIADQVNRARRAGPGFLNYCPLSEGRNPAQYDVMLPQTGPIGGWCQTHVSRQSGGDIIAFYAHWDARSIRRGQGTMVFTYGVPRTITTQSTPVAKLLEQTGPLPP